MGWEGGGSATWDRGPNMFFLYEPSLTLSAKHFILKNEHH